MVQINCSLDGVTLIQGNSFEPYLTLRLDCKYENYGVNEAKHIEIVNMKGKLLVANPKKDWFEVGYAELTNSSSIHLSQNTIMHLSVSISPYVLHRIEELRNGQDLYFRFDGTSGLCIARSNETYMSETLNLQNNRNECKYPRSEWIDHLNATEFNKIELVELPKIKFPEIELTTDISRYLEDSNRAMSEGRYGDVLQECRKIVNSLDRGIEEWGKTKITDTEKVEIQNNKESQNIQRKIILAKLLDSEIKAERLNALRNKLQHYLSLDPHEPEYKGIEFTVDDAKFVMHTVIGFTNVILKSIHNKQD